LRHGFVSSSGREFGPIRTVTTNDRGLLVVILENTKGVANPSNFLWKKNKFCTFFKTVSTGVGFASLFQKATIYDRVNQISKFNPDFKMNPRKSTSQSSSQLSSSTVISEELSFEQEINNDKDDQIQTIDDNDDDEDELNDSQPPQKRTRTENDEYYAEAHHIGLYELLLSTIIIPPKERLLRKVDALFLQSLTKRIKEDPSGVGIPPLAVMCTNISQPSKFEERLKDVYKYEVHGGIHSYTARQQLISEGWLEATHRVWSDVYCVMSDEEALWLASRHNANGHFHHKMSHRNYVDACRGRLIALSGNEDGELSSTLEWRRVCMNCIIPKDMSRTQKENIFAQATFSSKVYKIATLVMDKYEEGLLKDQKKSKKNSLTEIKQHHLQPLCRLPEKIQLDLLACVRKGELSLKEMKVNADRYRQIEQIKKSFVKLTNSRSWETAESVYPNFACADALQQFVSLSFKGDVPKSFQVYCQSAINSKENCEENAFFRRNGDFYVSLIESSLLSASKEIIKQHNPQYNGAQIILADFQKGISSDDIEKIAYNSRELNTSDIVSEYFFIATCRIADISHVTKALLVCYDHVEAVYAYDEESRRSGDDTVFVSSMTAVIVACWTQSGDIVNFNHHNIIIYNKEKSLKEHLIEILSTDGQTIIDATDSSPFPITGIKRNYIIFYTDKTIIEKMQI
jgi:hypothetical protein